MKDRDFFTERLRFSCLQIEILSGTVESFMMIVPDFHGPTGWNFIMNNWDFHDDSSRSYYERSRFSWWQIKILSYKRSRFYDDRLTFSWWQVEILIMAGQDFNNNLGRRFRLNPRARGKHFIIQLWWATAKQCSHVSCPIYLVNSMLPIRSRWSVGL